MTGSSRSSAPFDPVASQAFCPGKGCLDPSKQVVERLVGIGLGHPETGCQT